MTAPIAPAAKTPAETASNFERSITTTGIELRTPSRLIRDAVELLSSMRFSISLLTVICIASVIGTVVRQHEPLNNYVNQFGPFWAQVFGHFGLYAVYGSWWFLLILAFLVTSTSLCIARNAPKILVDLRTYKEQMREQALNSFHHKGAGLSSERGTDAFERVAALLTREGWRAKVQERPNGTMIAARRGATNKLGYIAAHSAIVLICLGGLLDGDLIVRLQMLIQGKSVFDGSGMFRDIGAEHRLGAGTPTFRANLFVSEGARSGTAVINMEDGAVLQELPFDVELKKFIVDYYETGMPKLFASDIVIHDRDTGENTAVTVKVNHPAEHRGVMIYQSSFEDGGSSLKLHALPLAPGSKPFDIDGVVGGSTMITNATGGRNDKLSVEFTGLRVINVENFGADQAAGAAAGGTDVRKVDLVSSLKKHLGSGAKGDSEKKLRNVGPSFTYKLRDAAGQAREFNNYMLPVELDGQRVFLAGVREDPGVPYRYLRIPADDQDSIDGWSRLRFALGDADLRKEAAARYVARATPPDKPQMAEQLDTTAVRLLGLFAGAESTKPGKPPEGGGLQAVSDFLENSVPVADRARISEVLLRILNGSLFELANLTREQAHLAPLPNNEATQNFMTLAVISLSDSFFYPAPVMLQLADFKQVQASVFQVARAPGKTLVYLGAVMLIIGVFTMLFIRERRLWVWLSPVDGGTRIATAMSTTRRTLEADAEFDRLKTALLKETR